MVIVCPKCHGSGEVIQGDSNSTAGTYKSTCPSCQGKGYVTDKD